LGEEGLHEPATTFWATEWLRSSSPFIGFLRRCNKLTYKPEHANDKANDSHCHTTTHVTSTLDGEQ
jgi:hypothetical protein